MVPKIGETNLSPCGDFCLTLCICPFIGLYYSVKYTFKAIDKALYTASDIHTRCRVKLRRLPKSKPLATAQPSLPPSKPPGAGTPTSFLHLPPEIRLEIYRLALGPRAIAQVRTHSAWWGPRPETWDERQGVRGDADPPSETLRCTVGLGGSGLHQLVAPPAHGCVHYGAVSRLLCGEKCRFAPGRRQPRTQRVVPSDLLRACRAVYAEALDVLYAGTTASLFGAPIARYFCRNASPEGLARLRFVHVAHVLPSDAWDSAAQRRSVEGAMRLLRDALPGLRQLDVEVALAYGQPKDPERFWAWLREDVLGHFRGLERFVLKVSVYTPFTPPRGRGGGWEAWTPPCEPLSSWNDDEYRALKARATSSDEEAVLS
ncbi:hypothetical protein F5Y05DRAFT_419131 [Hypoxylon sp. FL0543]|nr:hypothetical protein F5Y05DRAFT_419131 [Hypoxylon sp. FL0543]